MPVSHFESSRRSTISRCALVAFAVLASFLAAPAGAQISYGPATNYASGPEPFGVAVGDLDQDGLDDFAVSDLFGHAVSVYLNSGTGAFASAVVYPLTMGALGICIGDFDNDGVPDLAVSGPEVGTGLSVVAILLGSGGGAFGTPSYYPCAGANGIEWVHQGDFNEDGNLDVSVTVSLPNTPLDDEAVAILLGDGLGGLGAASYFPTAFSCERHAVGDLNHDGHLDVVVANYASDLVHVLLGNGNGTLQPKVDFATGDTPEGVAIGDVNLDGNPDIIAALDVGDGVSVLLGDGTGNFASHVDYPAGNGPEDVVIADVGCPTPDGIPDLLVAAYWDNSMTVLPGNGNGTFGAPLYFPADLWPNAIGVGNFNGQAPLDAVIVNVQAYTASVLLHDACGSGCTVACPDTVCVDEGATATFAVTVAGTGCPTVAYLGLPPFATASASGGGGLTIVLMPGYGDSGYYTVSFYIPNGGAPTDTCKTVICVRDVDRPPVCEAGGPYSGVPGTPIAFDGTGSYDPDGGPLTYTWDYGDGNTGLGATPQHSYATPSTYTVTLCVTDASNVTVCCTTTATIQGSASFCFACSKPNRIRLNKGPARYCFGIQRCPSSQADVTQIDPQTVVMSYNNQAIPTSSKKSAALGDCNRDGIPDLEVCFDRSALQMLFAGVPLPMTVSATISGFLLNGVPFSVPLSLDLALRQTTVTVLQAASASGPTLEVDMGADGALRAQVFDVRGRLVATVADGSAVSAGVHDFVLNGAGDRAAKLSTGIYFYRVVAGDEVATGRFVILK